MSAIIPSGFYQESAPSQIIVPDLPTGSLLAYYDAANTSSFYSPTGSGFTGSIWYDLSGNGYNLTQGGKRASSLIYQQNVFNTYPALYFTENVGFGDRFDCAYFTSSTSLVDDFDNSTDPNRNSGYYTASLGFTMFIVSNGSGLTYQMGTGGTIDAGKIRMRSNNTDNTGLTTLYNTNKTGVCTTISAVTTTSPASANIWAIDSYFASGAYAAGPNTYIWTNGQQSFSSTFQGESNIITAACGEQSFGSGEFIVGTNWVGSTPTFQGYIQAILIYDRTLSPQERIDVARFFAFRQYSDNPFQIPT